MSQTRKIPCGYIHSVLHLCFWTASGNFHRFDFSDFCCDVLTAGIRWNTDQSRLLVRLALPTAPDAQSVQRTSSSVRPAASRPETLGRTFGAHVQLLVTLTQAILITRLFHAWRITLWNCVSTFPSGCSTLPCDLFLDLMLLRYVPNISLSQRPELFPFASLQHLPPTCAKSHSSASPLTRSFVCIIVFRCCTKASS